MVRHGRVSGQNSDDLGIRGQEVIPNGLKSCGILHVRIPRSLRTRKKKVANWTSQWMMMDVYAAQKAWQGGMLIVICNTIFNPVFFSGG